MTVALRNLSARPQLVVDDHGAAVVESLTALTEVGMAGPLGRERVVEALPLNKAAGAVQLAAAKVLHDSQQCYVADPDGNLIGEDAVWVHRMAYARWTRDTRRLAG